MCWMELAGEPERRQLLPITFDIEPIGFQDSTLKSDLPGCYEKTFLKVRK